MARLMYGSGLRLMEVLRLRIKDVDFDRHAILVRAGKGDKDRITVLPDALARKYPGAAFQTGWQYVFPAANRARDPLSGRIKRHHIHHTSVQNAIKKAVRLAGIEKPASSHTLRHCFATHVLNRGGRGVRSPLDSR